MHFEILVEDKSGKEMLEILVPRILGKGHTYKIYAHRGIGHIPRNLKGTKDPGKQTLLAKLPGFLRGYGKTFSGYPPDYRAVVIVVCDLDDRCQKQFRAELLAVLEACQPAPPTRFCFAIEEGEAWLLGDPAAIETAYPKARKKVLNGYKNDSICGTWETLADAVYPGGVKSLSPDGRGGPTVGAEKSKWAERIAPHMNVDGNQSPSFRYFRDSLRASMDATP